MDTAPRAGLTGNQLKIIALISMTIDHVGLELFPGVTLLRILGRLAFPIFAYMVGEGCLYTHSRGRYLGTMAVAAVLSQWVYFFAMGSLYQCVLVTFSLSICLIYAIDFGRSHGGAAWAVPAAALAAIACLTLLNPLPGTDFHVDYGFFGVLLPVFVYLGTSRQDKFGLLAAGLILLNAVSGGIQWFSLAALIPLYFYNGQRGRRKMKYLFYVYYPLHLAAIYGISLIFS